MLIKVIVILMLLAIFVSLGSALFYLFRPRGDHRHMVRALTWRITISFTLFLLLMAGYYFGFITPTGMSPR